MTKSITQIDEAVIAININQTYREGISAGELYDNTRGIWRLDRDRAENADYAFAVFKGVVKEVYKIDRWDRELSTEYKNRQVEHTKLRNRFEFVGKVAQDSIRDKYVGKLLSETHAQNPIKYFNC
jgi:hypothetical protein